MEPRPYSARLGQISGPDANLRARKSRPYSDALVGKGGTHKGARVCGEISVRAGARTLLLQRTSILKIAPTTTGLREHRNAWGCAPAGLDLNLKYPLEQFRIPLIIIRQSSKSTPARGVLFTCL